MEKNDNIKNKPYHFNATSIDKDYYVSSEKKKNKITRRSTEEIIIEEIKNSNFFNNKNIVTLKSIANFTKTINNLNISNIYNKTKNSKADFFSPIFLNDPNNSNKEEVIKELPRIFNDTEEETENTNDSDYNNNTINIITIDPFLESLTKANICVNLTSFYNMASDSETFKVNIDIPKDGQYSVFILKTKDLISMAMGFEGEVIVITLCYVIY